MFYYRVEIRMFTLKLQCIDFNFHISRSWRRQLLLALYDSVIHAFSVHSVLFITLKIILFKCLHKELSLWWIFSYLVLLIGGLENKRSATIFCGWQVNTWHTYKHISKEWKILFCRLGSLNHCKYLNLFCNYTIWLFTAFAQINTSKVLQIICVDTLLSNGISSFILDRKIK